MSIALDASTPAAFSATPGTSITSASFTPPVGALVRVKLAAIYGAANDPVMSNTGGGLGPWRIVVKKSTGAFSGANSTVFICEAVVNTSVATTVKADFTSTGTQDIFGWVEVWTGASTVQVGAASASGKASASPVTPYTTTGMATTAANSQVHGIAAMDATGTLGSSDSGSGQTGTNDGAFSAYKSAVTATSGTSVQLNYTNSGNPNDIVWVTAEIWPIGAGTGPVINTQPAQGSCAPGGTATFSVTATASGGSLSYQWYRNGSSISGATSSTYTTPAQASGNNGDKFYCAVTDGNGTVNTLTTKLFISGLGDTGKAFSDRNTGWLKQRRGTGLRPHSFQITARNFAASHDVAQAGRSIWLNWTGLTAPAAAGLVSAASALTSVTASLTTAIQAASAAASSVSASGALTTGIPLAGGASVASSVSAALSTAIRLVIAASSVVTAAANLTTAIQALAGAVSAVSATGDLTVAKPLASSAVASVVATGDLTVPKPLAAAVQATVSSTGDLTVPKPLAANAQATIAASGDLTIPKPLAAAVQSAAAASAALTTAITMLVGAVANTVAVALLSTAIRLQTAAAVSTNATASLTASGAGAALTGGALSASNSGGSLATSVLLRGSVTDLAAAAGTLQTAIQAFAQAVSQSIVTGNLLTQTLFEGHAQAVVGAIGQIEIPIQLVANALDTSFSIADLLTPPHSQPPPVLPPPAPTPELNTSATGGYLLPEEGPLSIVIAELDRYILPVGVTLQ